MNDNNNSLHIKHIEFENTKTSKEIKELSDKLKIAREIIKKRNANNKSMLLADIENNLKKLTDAYMTFFDAFFNEHEIESMRDIYIENSKNRANETIKEVDKSTEEINKKLSNYCIDKRKEHLNKNNLDIASDYLDDALIFADAGAAYYYLCLIALTKNKLVDALINIKKAVSLGFNKKFCMHYIKIIKNKLN